MPSIVKLWLFLCWNLERYLTYIANFSEAHDDGILEWWGSLLPKMGVVKAVRKGTIKSTTIKRRIGNMEDINQLIILYTPQSLVMYLQLRIKQERIGS